MCQLQIGSNPIPDPASFSATFMSDVTFGFAVWLAVAAIADVALLPLALRRRQVAQIETGSGNIELPKAA
jgi:hypothetical protein